MIRYILLLVGLLSLWGWSWAVEWSEVLDVDIVTREEWGADESWRYMSSFVDLSPLAPRTEKATAIITYLITNHPDEVELDAVVRVDDGQELYRPYEYKNDKKAIVIHHTVSSQARIDEQGGVIPHLQQIYQFHTFTRKWGDIGYNFLIDKAGTIYEGRAGGVGVIGAHAIWNNNQAVGISLIGDFQHDNPTPEMLASLTELSAELASYYDIDPLDQITAHKTTTTAPYLEDIPTTGIAGHRDVGHTTCPGDRVYELLPQLREDVALLLHAGGDSSVDRVHHHLAPVLIDGVGRMTLEYASTDSNLKGAASCAWADGYSVPLDVVSCAVDDNVLSLEVQVVGPYAMGVYPLLVSDDAHRELRYVTTVWSDALEDLLYQRRRNFAYRLSVRPPETFEKIADPISIDRARDLVDEDVRVLLHDASIGVVGHSFSCEHACELVVTDASADRQLLGSGDMVAYMSGSFSIVEFEGVLGMTLEDGKDIYGSAISLRDAADGRVSIDTYGRTSYAGIPRNRFIGRLDILTDNFKDINTGQRKHEYVFVNELPFREYLYGIGEAAVDDPIEKQKVLALLTKQYATYYLSPTNEHPSMDEEGQQVSYDMIDDPRAFQKYVGVGWLDVYPAWRTIVDDMWSRWVMYDDYLPILPYFSCSPGLTWSAQERRGWTDTPWLMSVLDFAQAGCTDFAGHGVGLSGRGATYLARYGVGYADILRYYYHGIVVIE